MSSLARAACSRMSCKPSFATRARRSAANALGRATVCRRVEFVLRHSHPPLDLGRVADGEFEARDRKRQCRILDERGPAQLVDPLPDLVAAIRSDEARKHLPDQISSSLPVIALDRMPDGGVEIARLLPPDARPKMEGDEALGVPMAEIVGEHVAEQSMATKPLAVSVDRSHQRVRRSQILENATRAAAVEQRIAQRPGQPREHRRPREEIEPFVRQGLQQLLSQVLHDEPITAGELQGSCAGIRLGQEREDGEGQSRGPPFGVLHEHG